MESTLNFSKMSYLELKDIFYTQVLGYTRVKNDASKFGHKNEKDYAYEIFDGEIKDLMEGSTSLSTIVHSHDYITNQHIFDTVMLIQILHKQCSMSFEFTEIEKYKLVSKIVFPQHSFNLEISTLLREDEILQKKMDKIEKQKSLQRDFIVKIYVFCEHFKILKTPKHMCEFSA